MNNLIISPKPISTSNFTKRITTGRATEIRFRNYAESIGCTVIETSQHRDNPKTKAARHFPDFFIMEWATFIQVKSALNSAPYDHVIAEQDSFDVSKILYSVGEAVIIVWEFPDGTWHGQKVEKLSPVSGISDISRTHGSGTPAVKISKIQLKNFENIFDD